MFTGRSTISISANIRRSPARALLILTPDTLAKKKQKQKKKKRGEGALDHWPAPAITRTTRHRTSHGGSAQQSDANHG
jgi:hypothetical protein